jgi:two-component system, NarL family, sensor kinase
MKAGAVARLAWAGMTVALQLTALTLLFVSFSAAVIPPASLELTPGTAIAFVAFLAYPLVGGLIASRRPGNPVGWLLLAFSSGVALANANYLYSVFSLFVSARPLPGGEIAAWIDTWLWIIGLCPLAAVLLLYPTGR